MKDNNDNASKEIKNFFDTKFPLEKKIFETKDELLNFYVEKEVECENELKCILNKFLHFPYNKRKVALDTLLENLIISFELNHYSLGVTRTIQLKYKETVEQIKKDLKKIDKEKFVTNYILEQLNKYINSFKSELSKKYKRKEFPKFLTSKYNILIKNKYLTLLSENYIDVNYFYLSDNLIKVAEIYQNIFIRRIDNLFNCTDNGSSAKDYFDLMILSNNECLNKKKSQMLERLIKDFKYFIFMFNLDYLYENKAFDDNYNINKLIDKYKKEVINIKKEDAEKKKEDILQKIININNNSQEKIINIVLSYTLILNYLVTKNKKNGEVELFMPSNYISFASMNVLLDNTLNNFERFLNAEEIQFYSQSQLIKNLFYSQNYITNSDYSIEKIKDILINNSKDNKLQKLSSELFKNLNVKKHNKVLEFFLSIDQKFKDNNVRKINLSPLNPQIISTHCYIFISGFLSEDSNHYNEWEYMSMNLTANDTSYFYNWPGDTLPKAASSTLFNFGLTILTNMAKNYSKANEINESSNLDNNDEVNDISHNNNSNMKEGINNVVDCMQNNVSNDNNKQIEINNKNNFQKNNENSEQFDPGKSFIDSSKKAALSGKILAFILASRGFLKHQNITLVGFSLGTHVVKHCIKQLYKLHYNENIICNDIIKDVILIAGATSLKKKEQKYKEIFNHIINGKLINCYSIKDQVLNILYSGCMGKKPIGNSELQLDGYENLINIDFTNLGLGHTDYRKKMDLVMNKVDLTI